MLALVETGTGKRNEAERTTLLGMRCIRLRVASGAGAVPSAKGLRTAADELKRSGALRICLEKGYTCTESFRRAGFVLAGSETYRAAAAGKALKAAGGRCAAFFAPQLTPACEKTLFELCAHFERLMIKLDSGGEEVCAALEKLTGVSAVNDPSERVLLEADAAVFFSKPAKPVKLAGKCAAYSVRRRFPENVRCRRVIERAVPAPLLEGDLAERYDEEEILSEALLSGALKAEKIRIVSLKRLDSSGFGLYN